ncbi:DUF6012 family protein [Xanthomonas oryzae]
MLIHLTPKFYQPHRQDLTVDLVDLTVAELALNLIGGGDLTTRRPYPNKHYLVGCRKIGQKAVSGLLIKAEGHVPHYTVTTRWAVGAERLVSHVVRYQVLDDDFDCVTDEMTTWYASATLGWPSRWPVQDALHKAPCHAAPRMDLKDDSRSTSDFPQVHDTWSDGWLVRREESFTLHTVQLERLYSGCHEDRMPLLAHAFVAATKV